jgi:hypothetical protein
MTHPDPEYKKVGELSHYWVRLVIGKITLFVGSIAILMLISMLQSSRHIGTIGTWVLLMMAVVGFIALFAWDFWPSKCCPNCKAPMKKCRIRPAHPSPPAEEAMILSCQHCKTYIDLKVSIE